MFESLYSAILFKIDFRKVERTTRNSLIQHSILEGMLLLMFLSMTASGSESDAQRSFRQIEATGIENLFQIGTNVFSGGTPESDEAFQQLAELGVKTLVSVDGARPDIETARRHGMRYIHLPHGYDGIDHTLQLQLAKIPQSVSGPVFVHCHHGKHRGPTAAAIICMSNEKWSSTDAADWLAVAGTSTNYPGLYATVAEFQAPTDAELANTSDDFPEISKVSGLVDAMVEIDERWEHLKSIRDAGYKAPESHPDIDPVNEAVILWEAFREAKRMKESTDHGEDFMNLLAESEEDALKAIELLRRKNSTSSDILNNELTSSFGAISKGCVNCHDRFRN